MNTPSPRFTLLETVHGSHLYGMAHANSDLDTYRVVANDEAKVNRGFQKSSRVRTRQTLSGNDDVLVTSLTAFMVKCDEGVPQALEAMFSPFATGPLTTLRDRYRVNTPMVARTYRRTVGNFARLGLEDAEARELLTPPPSAHLHEREVESLKAKKPRRVERNGMLKYRRHALRLMLNMETSLEYGYFNPHLTAAERDFVFSGAEYADPDFAQLVFDRLWDRE